MEFRESVPPGWGFRPGHRHGLPGKLSALAATINEAAPDVLGVQEVGSPHALADLVDLLDGAWHTRLTTHFDAHHPIRVGVLSRTPITVLGEAVDFPDQLTAIQTGNGTPSPGRERWQWEYALDCVPDLKQ